MNRGEIMEEMVRLAVIDIRATLGGPVQNRRQLGEAVCRVYEGYVGLIDDGEHDDIAALGELGILKALASIRQALLQAAAGVGADKGFVAVDLGDERFVITDREFADNIVGVDTVGQTLQ
jgi:hypothetical protein